uniref:Kruppel like factor 12b n=1 Tax=Cyprinus carpio carpio TaxID=630221 RepID=A0A8C1DDL4_CYPCA
MLMLDGMPAVRVKAEPLESERGSPKVHGYPDMETVPLLLSKVKAEPPEDLLSSEQFQTQTEPVDLSINKTRTSSPSSNSSPITSAFSPSSSSSLSSSPSVITSVSSGMPSILTPGPLVGSSHGVRGQQFLHIIHPVPPSSPSKLPSQVHRIPVVVQSLPLMYTTAVRSPSTLNSTIMLPLLDEAKYHGKAQTDHNGLSPRQIKSDSDDDDLPNVTLDSVNETGSTALSIARAVQENSLCDFLSLSCNFSEREKKNNLFGSLPLSQLLFVSSSQFHFSPPGSLSLSLFHSLRVFARGSERESSASFLTHWLISARPSLGSTPTSTGDPGAGEKQEV